MKNLENNKTSQDVQYVHEFIRTGDYYEREDAPFRYLYARPSVTADTVIFSIEGHQLYVLLIQRKDDSDTEPGKWALPGGFLRVHPSGYPFDIDKSIEECARRELEEESHLIGADNLDLKLVGVFSKSNRDDRGRVLTVAYYNLTRKSDVIGDDDAQNADWFPMNDLPINLAFDHKDIITAALSKLRADFQLDLAILKLLDNKNGFTYVQLFDLYYAIYSDLLGEYDVKGSARINFYSQLRSLKPKILVPVCSDDIEEGKSASYKEKYRLDVNAYLEHFEAKKKKFGIHLFNLNGRY